jgi:hypothetical protein
LEIEIIDFIRTEDSLSIVFKNPEISEAGDTLTLETEPTTKPVFEPYEVAAERSRASAEFRSRNPIKFTGHCAYCNRDYELSDIYKGNKPKPKGKKKNTFLLI